MRWAELLPEGPAARVSPALRPLVEPPCDCGGVMRLEGAAQTGVADLTATFPCEPPDNEHEFELLEVAGELQTVPVGARLQVTVLCGACGHLQVRHGWQPAS